MYTVMLFSLSSSARVSEYIHNYTNECTKAKKPKKTLHFALTKTQTMQINYISASSLHIIDNTGDCRARMELRGGSR